MSCFIRRPLSAFAVSEIVWGHPAGLAVQHLGFADLSYAVYQGVIGIGISPGALGAA
jgi:hypothetical protein